MKTLRVLGIYLLWTIFLPLISYAFDSVPIYFPAHYHRLAAISVLGDTLELEDGSVWSISPPDNHKIFQWKTMDCLVIKPNEGVFSKYSLFSNYKYKILNKGTNEEIEVNLHLSPIVDGLHTNYIIGMDSYKRELILQDQSRWEIFRGDQNVFDKWERDDLIIIGVYDGGYFSDAGFILINVNTDDYCRAKRI